MGVVSHWGSPCFGPIFSCPGEGVGCLKYIEVDVEGLTDTVIALNDSGCQLCAVNAETVRSLDLPVFGHVKLRGISDRHLVPADVVKIRVRLTTGKGFVNITCGVVEKLNYPLSPWAKRQYLKNWYQKDGKASLCFFNTLMPLDDEIR